MLLNRFFCFFMTLPYATLKLPWLCGSSFSRAFANISSQFFLISLLLSHCLPYLHWVCWWGFLGGSESKESACSAGDLGLISGLGRSPEGRQDYPLQYSCLENPYGQRSLVGYSPRCPRVGHSWATKNKVYWWHSSQNLSVALHLS